VKTIVPPIKCQGIKTKLVPMIQQVLPASFTGTWIEPFCGSCVVALNVRPQKALLADTNKHIIALYQAIQVGQITPQGVKAFLEAAHRHLSQDGECYYYEVRARFNEQGNPLDFLFLNRSCFNGVMRFNSAGKFNVPFCCKPERFIQAYITKIVHQIEAFLHVMRGREWRFEVADFRQTLARVQADDVVYADPPYAGRHVDYFNSWGSADEALLVSMLQAVPCRFLLSTWQGNTYRQNAAVQDIWKRAGYSVATIAHFYHVGATESLRHEMIEALIANYPLPLLTPAAGNEAEASLPAVKQYALDL
jgi:DNA adenine methylase